MREEREFGAVAAVTMHVLKGGKGGDGAKEKCRKRTSKSAVRLQ